MLSEHSEPIQIFSLSDKCLQLTLAECNIEGFPLNLDPSLLRNSRPFIVASFPFLPLKRRQWFLCGTHKRQTTSSVPPSSFSVNLNFHQGTSGSSAGERTIWFAALPSREGGTGWILPLPQCFRRERTAHCLTGCSYCLAGARRPPKARGSKCNKRPARYLLFSLLRLCLMLYKRFCMEEIGLTGDTISINIAQSFCHFLSRRFCCKLSFPF